MKSFPKENPVHDHPFSSLLLHWHEHINERSLPWQYSRDPYYIWLSEILLQQTRVAQGLPYYERFVAAYPTIQELAAAADDEVAKLWQGLGYYARCRNLLKTARIVVQDYSGHFPNTYQGLLALPGIGPYTAAAIGSFAFGLPVAVVDGNVYRVLSRYFSIATPIDSATGRKDFERLAQQLLPQHHPAAYNQAIMDFGATVCTPALPLCSTCPLQEGCVALQQGTINILPVKQKKIVLRHRYFIYALLLHRGALYMQQRQAGDVWEGLYEPFMLEAAAAPSNDTVLTMLSQKGYGGKLVKTHTQRLTHQIIHSFWCIIHDTAAGDKTLCGQYYKADALALLPLPKSVHEVLHTLGYLK